MSTGESQTIEWTEESDKEVNYVAQKSEKPTEQDITYFKEHPTIQNLPDNWHELEWWAISQNEDNHGASFALDPAKECAYYVFGGVCHREGPIYTGDIETFMKAKMTELYTKGVPKETPERAIVKGELSETLDLKGQQIAIFIQDQGAHLDIVKEDTITGKMPDGQFFEYNLIELEVNEQGEQTDPDETPYWQEFLGPGADELEVTDNTFCTQDELVKYWETVKAAVPPKETDQAVVSTDQQEAIAVIAKFQDLATRADSNEQAALDYLENFAGQIELDHTKYDTWVDFVQAGVTEGKIPPQGIDLTDFPQPATPEDKTVEELAIRESATPDPATQDKPKKESKKK